MKKSSALMPLALLMPLAACVGSLLGGGKPAQLYQLERADESASAVPPASGRIAIQLQPIRFAPGIEGDRILAVTGQQALYLKGARWVADAPALFDQALHAGFARRVPELLLVDHGRGGATAALLQITVTHFEAVYADNGNNKEANLAPLVRIDAEALLLRSGDRGIIAQQHFSSEVSADENRVGPIVVAFGKASEDLVGKLADWSRLSVRVK